MKTGTIIALAVGAAAVLYYVTKSGGFSTPKSNSTTGAKPPVTATGNRDAAVRAGIDLGAKAGGAILDWLTAPSSPGALDLANGTGTASVDLTAPEGWL
jgi:hypothetical protein